MSRTLTCGVGVLRAGLAIPSPLEIGSVMLERHLEQASVGAGGMANLSLTLDLSTPNASVLSATTPTDAFWLQIALKRLTGNGVTGPLSRVGLIYADRWQRPGVLGMMFDLGFNSSDLQPVDKEFLTLSREGCAVFLDAINDLRDNETDRHTEALFTSVHELGHVFNLWHRQIPFRFMSSSRKDQVARAPFGFDAQHQRYLSHVDDEHVWPGGTAFGDRGDLGQSDDLFENALILPRSRSALRLHVSIAQVEFWRFEPIELDIRVEVPPGVKKEYRLPDTVDPGYDVFEVWIEEPTGERRRYRSPRHYCQNVGRLRISAEKPFARDLSIFGESGGYTFRYAGRHEVWATWRLPGDHVVESNHVEVNVKSSLDRSEEYRLLCATLTNRRVAPLLYHRDGRYNSDVIELIEDLASRTVIGPLKANLNYALGRFLYRVGRGRSISVRRRHYRRALGHLNRAMDVDGGLSRHKFKQAEIVEEKIRVD